MFDIIKKSKQLFILIAVLMSLAYNQSYLPSYRLELAQDSIHLGEPIIVKCYLVNNNAGSINIWHREPMGLLYYGHVDLYLITSSSDTSRYSVGMNAIDGSSPRHELNAHDSLYWYFILGWHNFARANTLPYNPGEFELFGSYYLTIKDSVNNPYSNATIEAKAVKFRVTEDVDPGLERQIHDEWMSLTREYLWWGERFKQTWTREDYNELCKQYAELNLPFAIYAHYFYCKSTKDEQEMKKFLKRYVDGPLPELIQFYLSHSDAQKKYPQNLLAR